MPPDGYTSLTLSDDVVEKLARIVAETDCDSYAEAVNYAVNETLAREDQLEAADLVDMLADRVE
ncbi:hypothetical protein IL252_10005 [Halomicrobium sp. IBSBa]|uniref:hypothetical protein n=1 Tax=Halomicrobium sp. IBSBa TaxID=2778916 RepID=UPI001AC0038D|nr:hypothetical protein [Halomicrobium sp. IBSBa]MBO4248146.1 hypothetical protein [Halomicrobium sp. IBSBa]